MFLQLDEEKELTFFPSTSFLNPDKHPDSCLTDLIFELVCKCFLLCYAKVDTCFKLHLEVTTLLSSKIHVAIVTRGMHSHLTRQKAWLSAAFGALLLGKLNWRLSADNASGIVS